MTNKLIIDDIEYKFTDNREAILILNNLTNIQACIERLEALRFSKSQAEFIANNHRFRPDLNWSIDFTNEMKISSCFSKNSFIHLPCPDNAIINENGELLLCYAGAKESIGRLIDLINMDEPKMETSDV